MLTQVGVKINLKDDVTNKLITRKIKENLFLVYLCSEPGPSSGKRHCPERNGTVEGIIDRLAANKSALHSKFYDVPAGRDNRWTDLHPARFLPGAAATATNQFIRAREVTGLTSPPALGCYDMTSVGMGGFVTSKGWMELGTYGSTKMKIEYFNINNAARSTGKKSDEEDTVLMKDIAEFSLALRTLRSAAQFATPWN
jgi:hypothetical protein